MSYHQNQPNITPGYVSYMLRLWYIQSGGDSVWRASLEEPLTQQVLRFDTLPSLFAFLLEQAGRPGEGSQGNTLGGKMPLTGAP